MKVITINRKRWLRGTGDGFLRNGSGKQCCLGFVCRDFGMKARDIFDHALPDDVDEYQKKLPEWLWTSGSNTDCGKAAEINDSLIGNKVKSERDRESKIKEIFARNGLRAKFVG